MEELALSSEMLREASEKGMTSISFFHGDHVLVVFFDASGRVRRTNVIKTAAAPAAAPAAPRRALSLEGLCAAIGTEKTAFLLAAFLAGGRLAVISTSPEMAEEICVALRDLSGLERPIVRVKEAGEALSAPEDTIIILSRDLAVELGEALRQMATVDLEARLKLGRRERRGLRLLLDLLERALALREEGKAFLRERLPRLAELMARTVELLGRMGALNEAMLMRTLGIGREELDLIYYVLTTFRGVRPERLRAYGVREFTL